jgi:hypothetical protein
VAAQLLSYLGAVVALALHQTNLVSFFSAQVCVVHGASLRLAGQKAAILCALEPTRFTYVHFVLESANSNLDEKIDQKRKICLFFRHF